MVQISEEFQVTRYIGEWISLGRCALPAERVFTWLPARGPKLSDHEWGDLCRDSDGELFLIGDAIGGHDEDTGCGCCSDDLTYSPIVAYASVLRFEGERIE